MSDTSVTCHAMSRGYPHGEQRDVTVTPPLRGVTCHAVTGPQQRQQRSRRLDPAHGARAVRATTACPVGQAPGDPPSGSRSGLPTSAGAGHDHRLHAAWARRMEDDRSVRDEGSLVSRAAPRDGLCRASRRARGGCTSHGGREIRRSTAASADGSSLFGYRKCSCGRHVA